MADQSPDHDFKSDRGNTRERPSDELLPGEQRQEKYQWEERRRGNRRFRERRQGDRRQEVEQQENNTRQRDNSRFWYDFMRFNLTGWSVVIPTLIGLALGNWIDRNYPAGFSWTLSLMAAGLFFGCLNAWYWIRHHDHNGRHK